MDGGSSPQADDAKVTSIDSTVEQSEAADGRSRKRRRVDREGEDVETADGEKDDAGASARESSTPSSPDGQAS